MANLGDQLLRNRSRPAIAGALPWGCSLLAHSLLACAWILGYCSSLDEVARGGTGARPGFEAVFISSSSGQESADFEAPGSASGDQAVNPQPPGGLAAQLRAHAIQENEVLRSLWPEPPPIELSKAPSSLGATAQRPDGVAPEAWQESPRGGQVRLAQALSNEPAGARRSPGNERLANGQARTSVFGAEGEGRKFVYVFDRSGSMDGHGGAPLSAAKSELLASLQDLDETHQFQIIFYNERPRIFSPGGLPGRLVFGTEQNKVLAEKFVGSITADGATRHEDALNMALRMVPDVIFFLTDADEPRMSDQQLARIAKFNRGTLINTIEFGYGVELDGDNFLKKIARQNGGRHVYIDISRLKRPATR
jgi:hypothetical protein